ncbi:MAG TPA: AMIN domain-containing protein, partial [Terriglobales bacterium]|nr:AMIN domain-containing protein [Terriglobales bacterium]
MSCARAHLCAIVLVALAASASAADQTAAGVQSVKIIPGESGATVEILATRPLTPQLQTVEGPLRLVIDLPGSILNIPRKRIPFRNQQIKGVRMNQYQAGVSRIVLDLNSPVQYTWDALGNRLNIRIRADEAATAKPATAPAMTPGTEPIAVPYAEGSTGTLVEAGSRVASGSTIAARDETAILRLARGGEIRVCAQTTVSVATSPDGQSLMLGMNTGAMETHYHLNESSDSILTPDFRIVLPGPGEFNLAIKSDARGDTCVSSLPGSNSSVVVAELLG